MTVPRYILHRNLCLHRTGTGTAPRACRTVVPFQANGLSARLKKSSKRSIGALNTSSTMATSFATGSANPKLRLLNMLRQGTETVIATFTILKSGRAAQVIAHTGVDVSKFQHLAHFPAYRVEGCHNRLRAWCVFFVTPTRAAFVRQIELNSARKRWRLRHARHGYRGR